MSKNAPRISGRLGVVHRVADEWRILIVDTDGGMPRVRTAVTHAAGETSEVRRVLEEGQVERTLQVVPASASVCRTCTLPDADEDTLESALNLQAETWLLAGTPPHRYGTGVLPKADAETSRTGLVASWPESAAVEEAPSPVPSQWVPAPVALAALLHDQRPAEVMAVVDRARGSVGLVICDPGGVSIRSTSSDLAGDWNGTLERVVVETALGGEHTPVFARRAAEELVTAFGPLGDRAAACRIPPSVVDAARRRLRDAGGDAAWWNTYGVAAGTALASVGSLAGAASLERDVSVEEASFLDRVGESISRPRTAVMAAVACILFLAVLPLLASGLRLAILEARHGNVAELAEQVADANARLAMYDALEDRSWPMTKLLSDIAASTPEGITFTNLSVSLDQELFSARGEALTRSGEDAPQRLLLMQRQLGQSDGVFTSVTLDYDRENNFGAYNFVIGATIARPFQRPEYPVERDFGTWTAWMRQQDMPPPDPDSDVGEDEPLAGGAEDGAASDDPTGSSTAPPDAVARADERPSSGATRPSSTPRGTPATGGRGGPVAADDRRSGSPTLTDIPRSDPSPSTPGRGDRAPREVLGTPAGGAAGGGEDARKGGAIGGGDVPEPLTEAQIATFDRSTALEYATRVSNASKRVRGVPGQEELEERLNNEFAMLMGRLRELRDNSSGGAS